MASRAFVAPAKPIFRASLRSSPSNGLDAFIPQLRKMVFEYCETWPTSANMRTYILNHLEDVARQNPHCEIVVKNRPHGEPIVRGFYLNTRDKVIGLKDYEVNGIQKKVELLLDSSGAKIRPLKGSRVVESTTEAARGIWSGMHVDAPFKI
ncbi:hypothetical protein PILCRDRAFT_67494 [Piloderma croceum F 1598]|uniref:Large ribosomal subunit protein mL43 n=1 Tax=Piloderma croceum (strain F 1598) TaxID=765440 RepID=A0A0C3FKS9_PILCF|nr:hypothetical protein PILCRDRAFT_67494 [Piloderma croceum F 1598]